MPGAKRPPVLALAADGRGRIGELAGWGAARGGLEAAGPLPRSSLIPLPPGSTLFALPGRAPLACDPATGEAAALGQAGRGQPRAVAAFLPPGYLSLHAAAWREAPGAPPLPLFAYTAVAWRAGKFVAAARRIEADPRRRLERVAPRELAAAARALRRRHPGNRLAAHLVDNCVRRYRCPNARSLVLGFGECPVPAARGCNAACLGCLSAQDEATGVTACHERLAFRPTVAEIVEFAAAHLERAPRPLVSFGQGCEGEPLTEPKLLEEAIRALRRRTKRGLINLNTNGSRPAVIERLCRAGLDSVRVSLNSARPEYYRRYFRPRGYAFSAVLASLRLARRRGCWTAVNYLVVPGFTDRPAETAALAKLIKAPGLDQLQLRNLNLDPGRLRKILAPAPGEAPPVGLGPWLADLRRRFPRLAIGAFNRSRPITKA